jgi:hypothetical protein
MTASLGTSLQGLVRRRHVVWIAVCVVVANALPTDRCSAQSAASNQMRVTLDSAMLFASRFGPDFPWLPLELRQRIARDSATVALYRSWITGRAAWPVDADTGRVLYYLTIARDTSIVEASTTIARTYGLRSHLGQAALNSIVSALPNTRAKAAVQQFMESERRPGRPNRVLATLLSMNTAGAQEALRQVDRRRLSKDQRAAVDRALSSRPRELLH